MLYPSWHHHCHSYIKEASITGIGIINLTCNQHCNRHALNLFDHILVLCKLLQHKIVCLKSSFVLMALDYMQRYTRLFILCFFFFEGGRGYLLSLPSSMHFFREIIIFPGSVLAHKCLYISFNSFMIILYFILGAFDTETTSQHHLNYYKDILSAIFSEPGKILLL